MKSYQFLFLFIFGTLLVSCYGDGTGIERTCENLHGLDPKFDLILTTQTQVDLSANLTHIKGSVYIGSCPNRKSSRITNLRGLRNLTKIDGNLTINETDITIIEDFGKLENIAGGLSFFMNASLQEIKNLNSLKSVSNLNIFGNPKLLRISGFSALESCQSTITINVNENLQSIKGFNKLTYIGEDLSIEGNSKLEKIEGFEKLATVEKNILFNSNVLIREFKAFNNLKNIGESLDLRYNWSLITLNNFQSLDSIRGSLVIDNHKELLALTGLNSLIFIGNQLYIANNPKLSNFCGIMPLIQTEGGLQEGDTGDPYYVPYFQITDNLYNPSRQDLLNGNCSI